MKTVFNGTEVKCDVGEKNFSKIVKPDVTPYLVWYDNIENKIYVDERADDSYIKYAAIHECICCGKYGHLARPTEDPELRCSEIDMMLIESMPEEEGYAYAKKRIDMFKTIISENLRSDMNDVFKKSLARLEAYYNSKP